MKGFFRWFKNSARMKRWMAIILIGIILACIGISKLMVAKTISFVGVGKVIVLFVVGFTMMIIGLVFSQKRVLEILVERIKWQ
jgi:1,4-dihydroxy-2-naphthoate octaprenyltransferase